METGRATHRKLTPAQAATPPLHPRTATRRRHTAQPESLVFRRHVAESRETPAGLSFGALATRGQSTQALLGHLACRCLRRIACPTTSWRLALARCLWSCLGSLTHNPLWLTRNLLTTGAACGKKLQRSDVAAENRLRLQLAATSMRSASPSLRPTPFCSP